MFAVATAGGRLGAHARGVALAVVAAGALACVPAPPGPPPNLLMVSLDTTRADHLSAYGYARDTSPNLRAVAGEGVRFHTVYAPTASTGSSHATLFTSLSPPATGVLKNGMPLAEDHVVLAERLREAGYQTAAAVSSFVLDARFGFGQGFDAYDDDFDPADATLSVREWEGHEVEGSFDRRADHTTDHAIRWLQESRDPERPFFLFVHYFDAHLPYQPPPPYRERFDADLPPEPRRIDHLISRYDGEIAFVDASLGRLLESLEGLGLAGNTLLVVIGDHGEGLMEHGVLTHGIFIYEEATRVPWILRWPQGALRPGRDIDEPVGLIDVAPTLLGLLGLPGLEGAQGADLAPRLRDAAPAQPTRPIFLYRRPYPRSVIGVLGKVQVEGELIGLRAGPWKYIEGSIGTQELYDVERDPREERNLAPARPGVVAQLQPEAARWRHERVRPLHDAPELTPQDREALEALGYIQ